MADPTVVDPTVSLIVAGFGFLGVTVAPIVLAFINRGGRSTELPPDVAIPRSEYDALLEHMARLDDESDRLTRERDRLDRELDEERERRVRAELKVETLEAKGRRRARPQD